jgi:hypothetical protein
MTELCGHPTINGPCSMKKGHVTSWHRHRPYNTMVWVMKDEAGNVIDSGTGINDFTYSISTNRRKGVRLVIEMSFADIPNAPTEAGSRTAPERLPQPSGAMQVSFDSRDNQTAEERLQELAALPRECNWCGKDINDYRSDAVYCGSGCRAAAHRAAECFYCGMPAVEREHVIPLNGRASNNSEVVPTCYECNRLASNNQFDSVLEKFNFIQERIRAKYEKLLNLGNWTSNELNELGPQLRAYVKSNAEFRLIIERRLSWNLFNNG